VSVMSENAGGHLGIFEKHLVEIPHAVKEDGIWYHP